MAGETHEPAEGYPHLQPGPLSGVVNRNIRALLGERHKLERRKNRQQRIADGITRFTGSMPFVYLHLFLFGGWLLVNSGAVPWVKPFDPFPFVMLAMWASVEAIFLSTFVLISQNRQAELADKRADLDLQVNLLAEHEITRLIHMVDGISAHLGVESGRDAHLEELKRDVAPEKVLEELEKVDRDEPH
ncbi:DUF1003 domain-containing protein [Pyxidicoccus sp. 3LG]